MSPKTELNDKCFRKIDILQPISIPILNLSLRFDFFFSGLDQQNTSTGQQQTGGSSMTPGNPSDSEGAGSNPASVGRRRHTSSGQSQVRSLYDGLSHLYTDCDSRYVK